jgi:hypothetical protein
MKLRPLVFALLACAPVSFGCKDDADNEAYPTYQECFDDHTESEMLPVKEAIVVCCLEHPIDGVKPVCKTTAPDCINYLTDNLKQTSASTVEVAEACDDYIAQMAM